MRLDRNFSTFVVPVSRVGPGFVPGPLRSRVTTRHVDRECVAAAEDLAGEGTRGRAVLDVAVDAGGGPVGQCGADVVDPGGSEDRAEELEDLRRCAGDREGEDILAPSQAVVGGQRGNVAGVVEESGPLHADIPWVVLAKTLQALAARPHDVGSPLGTEQSHGLRPLVVLVMLDGVVVADVDGNAAVDDRDEVPVGGDVQGEPRPGSIDTAEQDVAVQRP